MSSCSEQNFLFDPEAAHIVLQEAHDAVILPFEVSQRHSIPFVSHERGMCAACAV